MEKLASTRSGTDISSYLFGENLPVETAFAPILTLHLEGLIFIIVALCIEIGVLRSNQALSRGFYNCRRCSCCSCCYDVETTPFYLDSEDVKTKMFLLNVRHAVNFLTGRGQEGLRATKRMVGQSTCCLPAQNISPVCSIRKAEILKGQSQCKIYPSNPQEGVFQSSWHEWSG